AQLNAIPEGWVQAMGMTITHATKDEVRAELAVGQQHLQGYGIVHGGVHCGIIETLSSMGAYLFAREMGKQVVGLENSTSFIRAACPRGARSAPPSPRPARARARGCGARPRSSPAPSCRRPACC